MASQIIRATVVTFLVGQEIPWEEYFVTPPNPTSPTLGAEPSID